MCKPRSGLFQGTAGDLASSAATGQLANRLQQSVTQWAENLARPLTGGTRRAFYVACVAFDETTGRCYYGRNKGFLDPAFVRNPLLFGDSTHKGILPSESREPFPVGNCAEVDAINSALNDGASLSNLHISVISARKNKMGELMKSCKNCTYTFRGRIKANYSGWTEDD